MKRKYKVVPYGKWWEHLLKLDFYMAFRAMFGWKMKIPTHSMVLDNLGLTIDLSEPRTAEDSCDLLGLTLLDMTIAIKKEINPTVEKIALTLDSMLVPEEYSKRIWESLSDFWVNPDDDHNE